MNPHSGIILQARVHVKDAKTLLADYAQCCTPTSDTTKTPEYIELSNCIWTVENTVDALLTLQNSSPDDLLAAIGRLQKAVRSVHTIVQRLRQIP